ncbi:MAG TPA: BadF/BadG/BcrA/BcrD ATPase family protein [Fimbriimonadaceae bacterium]|jgi:N-acetylglucosamine kinase-like BadF-type ATPase
MIYLGLDCGGSSTRALATDENDEVLFRGNSGAANLTSTPDDLLRNHIKSALRNSPVPSHVCGCFAGLITPDDGERAANILKGIFPNSAIRVEPDYCAALAACPNGTDICVIAGTGSLVCSRPKSNVFKSGGRGYLLGDYGSAFRYGREFLQHHLDSEDIQQLAAILNPLFGSTDEALLLSAIYRGGPPAPRLAKLAAQFAQDVTSQEPYALDFLLNETQRLSSVVISHAEQHFPLLKETNVCLAGGLWKISPIYESELEIRLKELSGGRQINIHRIKRAPVMGAVILAKEATG